MKILINSYPWSGHIDLAESLIRSVDGLYENKAQWPQEENWILWKQESILFLPKFENVTFLSVIRDPEIVIPLLVDKMFNGYSGIKVMNKDDRSGPWQNNSEELLERDFKLISYQIKMYKSYIECLEKSPNNIKLITHDQCINNINDTIIKILTPLNIQNIKNVDFVDTTGVPQTKLYNKILNVVKEDNNFKEIKLWYQNKKSILNLN